MGTATDNSLSTQAGTGIKQDNGANALSTKAGTEVNKDEERRLMAQAGGATAPGFVAATTTAIVGPELSNGAQVVQDLDAGIQNFRGRNGSPDFFVKPDGANHSLSSDLSQQAEAQARIVQESSAMLASIEAMKLKAAASMNPAVSARITALSTELNARINSVNAASEAYKAQEAKNVEVYNKQAEQLKNEGDKLNTQADHLEKIKAKAKELEGKGKKAESQDLMLYVKEEKEILATDQANFAKKCEVFESKYLEISSKALDPLYKSLCDARGSLHDFLEPSTDQNGQLVSGQAQKLLGDLNNIANTTGSRIESRKIQAALNGEEMTDKMAAFVTAPATEKYSALQNRTLDKMSVLKDDCLNKIKDDNVRAQLSYAYDNKQAVFLSTKRNQSLEQFLGKIKDRQEREDTAKAIAEGRAIYVNSNDKNAKAFAELLNTFNKNETALPVERGTRIALEVPFANRVAHITTAYLGRQENAIENNKKLDGKKVDENTLKLRGVATKYGHYYGPDSLESKVDKAKNVQDLANAWKQEWQKVAGNAPKNFWQKAGVFFSTGNLERIGKGVIKGLPYTIALGAVAGAFHHDSKSSGNNGGSGGSGSGN